MIRSRAALAVAACLAGVVSGSIAAAQADTGSTGATGTTGATSAPATITMNGAGSATVDSSASSATVHASYLTALTAALADAKAKGTALAAAAGDTLGVVENITEQTNDGNICSGPVMFASGTAKGAPSIAPAPGAKKRSHHGSKPKATVRIADAIAPTTTTCTIEADVTVTYAMAPA
jgi:ribonuclease HI